MKKEWGEIKRRRKEGETRYFSWHRATARIPGSLNCAQIVCYLCQKWRRDGIKTCLLLLLLSCFSRVRLCATPETAAHQASPSLGFSRQEHWSGLPFPPMHESEKWKWSYSVVSGSRDPIDCSPPGSSVHGIFQAKVLEWYAIAFSEICPRTLNSRNPQRQWSVLMFRNQYLQGPPKVCQWDLGDHKKKGPTSIITD